MDWRGKPLSFSQQRSQSLTLFFGFVMSKPFPDFIFVLSYWFRSCFFPYCLLLIGFPFGFSFVFHFGSQVTGLDRFLFSYLRFCFFFCFFVFFFHFHIPVFDFSLQSRVIRFWSESVWDCILRLLYACVVGSVVSVLFFSRLRVL